MTKGTPSVSSKTVSGKTKGGVQEISVSLIRSVRERLAENKRVRRNLPEKGRLHIDRQLPFLCVYRQPAERDDPGTEALVKGEASYLIAPGAKRFHKQVSDLVRCVAETLSAQFGAFLILEIWAAPDEGDADDPAVPGVPATFRIDAPVDAHLAPTVAKLEGQLKRLKVLKQAVLVETNRGGRTHPNGFPPLLSAAVAGKLNCSIVSLSVPPVYRREAVGQGPAASTASSRSRSARPFPLLLRSLRRNLGLVLRRTYFEFSRTLTTHRAPHFHSLGRRAVVKAVWRIDGDLARVSDQFDYLLYVTPANVNGAWSEFRRSRFERSPQFHYRPLMIDPDRLKRDLYGIRLEQIEDPALHHLFQEKQQELELKLTMLRDRDSPRFLYESAQLFGTVPDDITRLAIDLLDLTPRRERSGSGAKVGAAEFAKRARAEFKIYRARLSTFNAKVTVSSDAGGLMVSRGNLMINSDLSLPPDRVEALIAHEVGTHVVTYYNGRAQPLRQLYSGLAGYEELQEGLAVLAEYLVGGLSPGRLRQLAARVLAVQQMMDGASFVDTFRVLHGEHGFTQRSAYTITMRVYRGGGLTKDAVYLRGLAAIMAYVQSGRSLKPLMAGKMAVQHIPIIAELQYRQVLKPTPVVPRHLEDPDARGRLAHVASGSRGLMDLVTDRRPDGSGS